MRIKNRFTVSVPLDVAWKVLQDLERIAPCVPGAQLQEVDGEEHRGTVRVKVGSTVTQFKGAVRLGEVDEAAHRIVLKARGRQARGEGDARATFTSVLAPAGGASTEVTVDTNLSITGKLAPFGREVLADVSSRLLDEFANRLEAELANDDALFVSQRGAKTRKAAPERKAAPVTKTANKKTAAKKPAARRAAAAIVETPSVRAPLTTIDAREPATSVPNDGGARATAAPAPMEPQGKRIESTSVEPVDLLAAAGRPLAGRGLPVAVVAVLLVLALSKERGARLALAAIGVGLVVAMAKQAAHADS